MDLQTIHSTQIQADLSKPLDELVNTQNNNNNNSNPRNNPQKHYKQSSHHDSRSKISKFEIEDAFHDHHDINK